jgi:ribosome-binding factor A
MKDPRLQGITVTRVTIDRELQYADIYVHALGEEEREDEVTEALESASGFLRHQLGQNLRLRHVPILHFHWDPSLAHAEHINQLLDNLDIPAEEE